MFEIPPKSSQEINLIVNRYTILHHWFALIKFCAMVLRKRSDSEHSHFCFGTPTSIFFVGNYYYFTLRLSEAQMIIKSCPKYFLPVAVTAY